MLISNHLNDPIGPEIDKVHEIMREHIMPLKNIKEYDEWSKGPIYRSCMSKIEKLIKNRFGLNLFMHRGPYDFTDTIWCCNVIEPRSDNVLMSSVYVKEGKETELADDWNYFLDIDYSKLKTKFVKETSTIDQDKVYISGYLSKIPARIFHSYYHLFSYYGNVYKEKSRVYTAREATSTLFHELGHLITYIFLAHKTDRTNLFLNEIAISLHKSEPAIKRERLLVEMCKEDLLDESDIKDLLKEERPIIMGPKLFNRIYNKTYATNISKHYSNAASERMADDFCMKFGYGEEMLSKAVGIPDYKVRTGDWKDTIMDNIGLVSIVGLILTAFVPFVALFYWALPLISIYTYCTLSREDMNEHQYDWSDNYYKRIRLTYINELKSNRLPKEIKDNILKKIDVIDKIMEKIKPLSLNTSIYYKLARLLFKNNKEAIDTKREEILLEQLASNDLFLYSAKLGDK